MRARRPTTSLSVVLLFAAYAAQAQTQATCSFNLFPLMLDLPTYAADWERLPVAPRGFTRPARFLMPQYPQKRIPTNLWIMGQAGGTLSASGRGWETASIPSLRKSLTSANPFVSGLPQSTFSF